MTKPSTIVTKFILLIGLLFVTCEFFIYFPAQLACKWPEVASGQDVSALQVMFLADTHLLGDRLGHWFDKLRREWQMQRSFQTAVMLFQPDAVFILGDVTDEGKWENQEQFNETMARFAKMFSVPDYVELHVVAGNHDIGFHDYVHRGRLQRFQERFSLQAVKVIHMQDIVFVLVNSMAFHGDHCTMCSEAAQQLKKVSEQLNCSRYQSASGKQTTRDQNKCRKYETLPNVKPVLLQHFPMYRESDVSCHGPDAPPDEEKVTLHRVKMDVLSKEASDLQLSLLQPRIVLSGHTHHGCYVEHSQGTPEISVPSFSWRNRNNPSFILATITKEDFVWNKCFLPEESTVINIYMVGSVIIILWLLIAVINHIRQAQRENKGKME
ncbi:Metallophosphoesterase 1 [Holothuria leucospilota]|uniref:Metallophosphoesterase 1 n=1 Tax=Holothuria leucospilota TaxID=206669 RepID=A0A9Q1CBC2_HOLLE|nr:Metallophosphoesterase 1 [Holothuria leucospilota]